MKLSQLFAQIIESTTTEITTPNAIIKAVTVIRSR